MQTLTAEVRRGEGGKGFVLQQRGHPGKIKISSSTEKKIIQTLLILLPNYVGGLRNLQANWFMWGEHGISLKRFLFSSFSFCLLDGLCYKDGQFFRGPAEIAAWGPKYATTVLMSLSGCKSLRRVQNPQWDPQKLVTTTLWAMCLPWAFFVTSPLPVSQSFTSNDLHLQSSGY